MNINQAKVIKKELEENIRELLQECCEETGLKFSKIEIFSHYDVEPSRGKYNIYLNIRNPFQLQKIKNIGMKTIRIIQAALFLVLLSAIIVCDIYDEKILFWVLVSFEIIIIAVFEVFKHIIREN